MLIGGLVTHRLISSCVVGVGSLIDESQNAVWPLALEDEFSRIVKNAVKGKLDRLFFRRHGRAGQNFRNLTATFHNRYVLRHNGAFVFRFTVIKLVLFFIATESSKCLTKI